MAAKKKILLAAALWLLGAWDTYPVIRGHFIQQYPYTFKKYGWTNGDRVMAITSSLGWPLTRPMVWLHETNWLDQQAAW